MLSNVSRALICLLVLLNGFSAAHATHPDSAVSQMLNASAETPQMVTGHLQYQQFESLGADSSHRTATMFAVSPLPVVAGPVGFFDTPLLRHDVLHE
ncbi:MAG: hypothetical protein AAFX04_06690 [Pseudomonadota bacterium]